MWEGPRNEHMMHELLLRETEIQNYEQQADKIWKYMEDHQYFFVGDFKHNADGGAYGYDDAAADTHCPLFVKKCQKKKIITQNSANPYLV